MVSSIGSLEPLPPRSARIGLWVGLCVWIGVVACGWSILTRYSYIAGPRTAPLASIAPTESSPETYRLRMFVHPRCPCSAASVRELERLMSHCAGRIETTVHFYRPEAASDDWVNGSLWEAVAAIPGVHAEIDPAGDESRQFGSTTSGDVLLYDSAGRLQFHGGITAARGHEGDNVGKSAVMSIVRGETDHVGESPVFGCLLRIDGASSDE